MESHPSSGNRTPVQVVAISIVASGIRARADGRTGREAWRIIRELHPRAVWAVAAYTAVLVLVASLGVTSLF
ncbi:hypothetical protein SAMN05446589_9070 [Streptomyces sp. OV198]|uniref:hypothetical protein n=1 Tax=Streptomyces sp. OV198 TaxID=1882787 RepID=UPI000BD7D802|nr:hypothetical protein [Streptomyces sp. OV198]SOF02008.1 hypothetical protein SAMN05446589_9070 [Streptomyces sp. OV198]